MRAPRNATAKAATLAACAAITLPAAAQHNPERVPRPGEVRFNQAVYKASHNSYERSEPLDEQVDEHNVWMVELDLFYDLGEDDGNISVEHFCFSAHNAQSLSTELTELNRASIRDLRPTVIILDMKAGSGTTGSCYDEWPPAETYRPLIYQTFIDALGEGLGEQYFYTAAEFKNTNGDNMKWPSAEELVRREKRWIVIIGDDDTRRPDSDFFFGVTFSNPPTDSGVRNRVLVNRDMGCDTPVAPPVQESPRTRDDRWMYRAFPNGACDICVAQNGPYWDNAVARGWTFVATNCVKDDHTWDPRTHSPMPVFLEPEGTPDGVQRGTIVATFVGTAALAAALPGVSPGVPIYIIADDEVALGIPTVPSLGPREIRTLGQPVTITAP